MSENVIKIKCLDENCKPVKNGDWIDLFTAEDVKLLKFDFYLISLGVAM